MKKIIGFFCWGIFALMTLHAGMITPGHLPDDFNIDVVAERQIVEVTPRGGLPNFFGKLNNKAPEVRIAYFGGSITEQDGYRVYSTEYLQKMYPDTKIISIHAAIGGTDSELGAMRCQHDVIVNNPDLVIVEFAVNDYCRGPRNITKSMEGIIRQIWKSNPKCDIMFVYTTVERDWMNTDNGRKQRLEAAIMEQIADYYDIPTVDFAKEILGLVADGKLVMKASKDDMSVVGGDTLNVKAGTSENGNIPVNADGKIPFAHDGVHPHLDTGHVIYEQILERSWPVIMDAGKINSHILPEPIMKDCQEIVTSVPMNDNRIKISGPWRQDAPDEPISKGFLHRFNPFFSFQPGSEITIKFKGSQLNIYTLFGPSCGSIEYSLDGNAPKKVVMFDGYCFYHRLVNLALARGTDPNQMHTVVIRVLNEDIDKRQILFEHNRQKYDKNPEWYTGKTFYAGCIFVIGELLQAE